MDVIQNLSFKRKIGLLVVSAVAGLAIVTSLSIYLTREEIVESRRAALRTAVESAYSIAAGYQAAAAAGTMKVEDAQKAAKDAIRAARYGGPEGKSDYFYIFGMDGNGVMHPVKPELDGQPLIGKVKDAKGNDMIQALTDGLRASKDGRASTMVEFPRPGTTEPVPKLQYVMLLKNWDWMVGSGLYMDDVSALARNALLKQLGVFLGALLAIGTIGVLISRSVIKQLGGEPSDALAIISEVSKGNLAVHIEAAPAGSLVAGLQTMIESVRSTLVQVRASTDSISTASNEIAVGNQDLSQRTEQTASNLQLAASSMEQLTGTVKQSADSARQANQLAASAAEVAARGGSVVSQVVTTMDEINASSKKISDIIGVIDGIAFQTNILALNAAVEAARAGEAGRGFAVVATEVRALAQRASAAAREIKSLILASVEQVSAGADVVKTAGSTIEQLVETSKRVNHLLSEIAVGADEQARGVSQTSQAVQELDNVTQQNAALVEETAAAAASLSDQARALAAEVARFKLPGPRRP